MSAETSEIVKSMTDLQQQTPRGASPAHEDNNTGNISTVTSDPPSQTQQQEAAVTDSNHTTGAGSPIAETENGDLAPGDQKRGGSASMSRVAVEGMNNVDEKEEEYARRQQERRDREPLWYCRIITQHPKKAFALTLAGQVFFLFLTMALQATGYDIIPLVFDRLPLDIKDDPDFLRGLAYDYRSEQEEFIKQGIAVSGVQTQNSEMMEVIEYLYNYPENDRNILTADNLQAIADAEQKLYEAVEPDFCFKPGPVCMKTNSLIQYFDGRWSGVNTIFNDPNYANIPAVIYEASTNVKTREDFKYFLGADYHINATHAYMSSTRANLMIGWPLEGFSNTSDREDEQRDKLTTFITDEFVPIADKIHQDGINGMEFLYSSATLFQVGILGQVMQDMILVGLAFIFIMVFICLQTGSLWVAGFAVLSILTGFCCANACYRILLDFRYFGIFHILALFIILGIGADDVFVFYDTWKETSHHQYKSLAHRMSDCYRKASLAMLFTSMTTGVAFFVSATSPFLAVYSFGAFAGLLVVVNYISVVVFFPCVVTTYHLYWEKFKCCCCCPRGGGVAANVAPAEQAATEPNTERKNPIVRFFAGPYYKFVTHKIVRWIILAFYVVLFILMCVMASKLEVEEEQIEFLKESTQLGRYLKVRGEAYPSSESGNNAQVYLVWGLKEQDVGDCHHSDPECTGTTVWDDDFTMDSVIAQQELLDLCVKMKGLPTDVTDRLKIKINEYTNEAEVLCYIQPMKTFYTTDTSYTVPLDQTEVTSLMSANGAIFTSSLSSADMAQAFFEVGMSFWMLDDPPASSIYEPYLGEVETDFTVVSQYNGMTYYYGTRLRYMALMVNTTIDRPSLGYPTGLPIREDWETYTNAWLSNTTMLKDGWQCTPEEAGGFNLWHWLKVQKKLVSSAVVGIIVGIMIALPILIIATHNVIIGFMATGIIGAITVCVVGTIPAAGWKLGLLESLNLVLVVGLAVDYIVHLAEGYARSIHNDRLARTHDMLSEVGISVVSGAATTLGACIFMLPSKIIFFTKFGLFIFSTIGFSLLFALGLFPTVVALIGPQGEFGSLKPCYKKMKCCGDQKLE